jgi:hypothetical protein
MPLPVCPGLLLLLLLHLELLLLIGQSACSCWHSW